MALQISGPNAKFLKTEFIAPRILEILEPNLAFIQPGKSGMLPMVKANAPSVAYKKETTSASSDSKKVKPRKKTPGTEWTYVTIDQLTQDTALLGSNGFAVRIDRDAIRFTEGIDEIKRAYNRIGYWTAEYINDQIISEITTNATTPTWTPTAVWSAATATPVEDLIKLYGQMKREGYPYRMTDVYLHDTNWQELLLYLTNVDVDGAKQKAFYGVPEIDQDVIRVPVVKSDIHSLMSGLDEGYALGLDRNNPCGTVYYNVDPAFGSAKITYNTVENGKKTAKTINNPGINVHQYVDDDTHEVVIQVWVDFGVAIKEQYAALYDSGV